MEMLVSGIKLELGFIFPLNICFENLPYTCSVLILKSPQIITLYVAGIHKGKEGELGFVL
jgi:hypothetical protein